MMRGLFQHRSAIFIIIFVGLSIPIPPAASGELVYTPNNPSFGGNPQNGVVLMNAAQLQNTFTDPAIASRSSSVAASSASKEITPNADLEKFKASLERQVLSLLSRRIINEAFGANSQTIDGSFEVEGFTVQVEDNVLVDGFNTIEITLEDHDTGESTVISLPKADVSP